MKRRIRLTIQSVAVILQNANVKGFFTGKIYEGQSKNICVPGLNCYSCPGAVGSCPIGALQNSLTGIRFKFPYYVMGLLLFFGALLGRAVCGFLCPFGLLQDLLHLIPFPKKIKTFPADKPLRKVKYLVLLVMVIALPIFVKLTPFFCKFLCPSGTVSGILLVLSDNTLLSVLGGRFAWKVSVLLLILLASILVYRPFCKYLCPLGAVYGPFNKIALLKMKVDLTKCTGCNLCANSCDMCVNPSKEPNHTECIRCGKCINTCPEKAIRYFVR